MDQRTERAQMDALTLELEIPSGFQPQRVVLHGNAVPGPAEVEFERWIPGMLVVEDTPPYIYEVLDPVRAVRVEQATFLKAGEWGPEESVIDPAYGSDDDFSSYLADEEPVSVFSSDDDVASYFVLADEEPVIVYEFIDLTSEKDA